ncbi:hypothetical protein CSUI_006193 [Cystoisospora suis]|uniref:Transmembrane protein n=1 Tax=Cystoisospora suis TaxID=483139 RepID=A0A2C6KVC1_9APIC|nr:hypothetical protein CSUI_006193 [Cystoisospora suis]
MSIFLSLFIYLGLSTHVSCESYSFVMSFFSLGVHISQPTCGRR